MFDNFATHHVHSGPSHVDVKVTEKRAPTDESVRLLAEMQQKVVDGVLGQMKIDVNDVKGEIMVFREPWTVLDLTFGVAYNVNGKRHHFRTSVCEFEVMQAQNEFHISYDEAMLRVFATKFAQHIAAQILNSLDFNKFGHIMRSR